MTETAEGGKGHCSPPQDIWITAGNPVMGTYISENNNGRWK